jgi:hypothetical protein
VGEGSGRAQQRVCRVVQGHCLYDGPSGGAFSWLVDGDGDMCEHTRESGGTGTGAEDRWVQTRGEDRRGPAGSAETAMMKQRKPVIGRPKAD